MHTIKLLAVLEENKQGQLARLTRCLAAVGVNIRWVTIATLDKVGVVKILVDHLEKAVDALRREGFAVSTLEVLAVEVPDQPGALCQVTEALAGEGINLENASGFVVQPRRRAVLLFETNKLEEAWRVLQKQGLRLFTQAEVLAI